MTKQIDCDTDPNQFGCRIGKAIVSIIIISIILLIILIVGIISTIILFFNIKKNNKKKSNNFNFRIFNYNNIMYCNSFIREFFKLAD